MNDSIELVVTVKAYPALSQKYGEVVCVAGVRTDTPAPEWVRLFPVQFRDMAYTKQFHKYQPISVAAHRHDGDKRPETYRPTMDSIKTLGQVIPTRKGWAGRWPLIEPLMMESMCELKKRQELDGTSLGAFRPAEVTDLTIDDGVEPWNDSQAGRVRSRAKPPAETRA